MALILKDRVKETTTTAGTGTYTLGGAETGFEAFSQIGNGNTTYYCCTDGSDFEIGIGTYTLSGTTLARTTILQSSNSDAAVSWTSGATRIIFCTQPGEKAVYLDGSDQLTLNGSTVTSSVTELNILDGVTASAADINLIDGITNGTVIASKAIVTDANKDITGGRNITISGEIDAATGDFSGAVDVAGATTTVAITATGLVTAGAKIDLNGTELILDADADTSITADTDDQIDIRVAGADQITIKDGAMSPVTDSDIDLGTTSLRYKDAFIDTVTTTGNVTVGGDLTVTGDDIIMGTNTAGHILVADGTNFNPVAVTDLAAITSVADGDTLLAVDASGGGLKKIAKSALVAGLATSSALTEIVQDDSPQLGANLDTNSFNILIDDAHFIGDESGNEQLVFQTTGSAVNQFEMTNAATDDGSTFLQGPILQATGGDSNIDLNLIAKGTGVIAVRGNSASGAVQFNCESNSHGQIVQGQPHSAGVTNTMLLPAGANSTLVSLVSTDTLTNKTLTSPKVNEDVAVTSTASELNILDGATVVVGEINALDIGSTAVGTAVASKAVILDSNKDYTGIRNFTITGEIDAATGDFSGAVDIAGTTNLDVVDIDGAVDMATTLQVDGAITTGGLLTAGAKIDLNGTELILDADADCSITADTDDTIDIRVAGADDFQITANTFTILSGSTIAIAAGGGFTNAGSMSSDITSTGKALVFGF